MWCVGIWRALQAHWARGVGGPRHIGGGGGVAHGNPPRQRPTNGEKNRLVKQVQSLIYFSRDANCSSCDDPEQCGTQGGAVGIGCHLCVAWRLELDGPPPGSIHAFRQQPALRAVGALRSSSSVVR
mmetsp:Transcript_18867/g.33515  ORF Transcript_18867/g.33515 Transcript_18867/m.33515 type:complete len:126 (-) Transcript_18867:56-433(-)